jgi:hypothetical protein
MPESGKENVVRGPGLGLPRRDFGVPESGIKNVECLGSETALRGGVL